MRRLATAAAALLIASTGAAADRGGGTITFVEAGGSKRVLAIPGTESAPRVPEGSHEHRNQLWPAVVSAARAHGLDPELVDLVIRMESGYNPRAVSPKGARGIMQLLPSTASLFGVTDIFDARDNILGGVRYLAYLLERFGANVGLALAAYNAGPEAVEQHRGVPPFEETRAFVSAILAAYKGAPAPILSGGFGRPTRPVELSVADGEPVISNVPRAGEAPLARRLSLR